jgi:hypothetical protein
MKTKFFATLLVVLAVLFGQVGGVLAAPVAQDTTLIEGTVTDITTQTTDGVTTVLVTVKDDLGVSQTYRLSVEDADGLDLVIVDEATNTVTVDSSKLNQPVSIDTTVVDAVLVEEEVVDEDPFNPVAGMLADFFNVSNTEINDMHEDGFGFGVIAQALWISRDVDGNTDTELATDILTLKQEKNFDEFFKKYPALLDEFDGDVPSNWGQFKKVLKENKQNLGQIVSNHANIDDDDTTTQDKGNGKDKKKDKGNNGKGKNP